MKNTKLAYLVWTGKDGDSGSLHAVVDSMARAKKAIAGLSPQFTLKHHAADEKRNLYIKPSYVRSEWARIDVWTMN